MGRGNRFTTEFKREAVRLTQTSGRTIKQVADDLGIGLSTLTRWKRKHREADLYPVRMTMLRRNWPAFGARTNSCARSVIC